MAAEKLRDIAEEAVALLKGTDVDHLRNLAKSAMAV